MAKLVIIEGVGKKDTIKKYLGAGYIVEATGGHFRDLQKNALSVDVEDGYKPKYVVPTAKKELVQKLKEKAAAAEEVFIATDPDREGEAIAYHLTKVLGIDPAEAKRIEFHEITKSAIQKALQEPRPINMEKFYAQQCRRILDRLVGYRLSPVVSKKIKPKLSAGRVQSVTLKMVVLREREIANFKPEEYWDFGARLEKSRLSFLANIATDKAGKKIKLASQKQVDAVLGDLGAGSVAGAVGDNGQKSINNCTAKFIVKDVRKSVTKKHAPAPYITSSMQQDALNRAGLSLKRCGLAAQDLYQGVKMGGDGMVALVTYIRTDSVRVSPEAQAAAREFVISKYGEKFLPHDEDGAVKYNFYKTKKSAQDAHEAIRPTHLEWTPERAKPFLSVDQYKLYKLIYGRFLASQMCDALFNSVSVDIDANGYGFRATGRTPIFEGHMVAYGNRGLGGGTHPKSGEETPDEEQDEDFTLPEMAVGDELTFKNLEFEQKFTKPPARYTEATLVKAMEENGIGRPATYNPIIQNIAARFYTEREGKSIKPTELGCTIVDLLDKYFIDIMDVHFTADMEDKLDDVAYEGLDWVKVIDDFYKPFDKKIAAAMDNPDEAYKIKLEETDIPCAKCGRNMVVRFGRFGKFLACPGFPECRNTLPYDPPVAKCPKCGKDVYKRKSKKGRFFWGCNGYPECDYATWDDPTKPAQGEEAK